MSKWNKCYENLLQNEIPFSFLLWKENRFCKNTKRSHWTFFCWQLSKKYVILWCTHSSWPQYWMSFSVPFCAHKKNHWVILILHVIKIAWTIEPEENAKFVSNRFWTDWLCLNFYSLTRWVEIYFVIIIDFVDELQTDKRLIDWFCGIFLLSRWKSSAAFAVKKSTTAVAMSYQLSAVIYSTMTAWING